MGSRAGLLKLDCAWELPEDWDETQILNQWGQAKGGSACLTEAQVMLTLLVHRCERRARSQAVVTQGGSVGSIAKSETCGNTWAPGPGLGGRVDPISATP